MGARLVRLTAGAAAYWRRKTASQRAALFDDRADQHRTTSRLERYNQELRRQEKLGTVGTEHNLLALLQIQNLLNQIT